MLPRRFLDIDRLARRYSSSHAPIAGLTPLVSAVHILLMMLTSGLRRMSLRKATWGMALGLTFVGALCAFQHPFHQFPGVEYRNFVVPEDWQQPGEWAFARLMFPPGPLDGYRGRFDGDWRQGLSLWTQDYPRADRHFSHGAPAPEPHSSSFRRAAHQS